MNITGTVRRVISAPQTGGAIFRLQADSRNEPVRVKADYSVLQDAPYPGERLTLTGSFKFGVYGEQFLITFALPELPNTSSTTELLLNHPAFTTIAKRRIRAISEKFGRQTLSVLDNSDFSALESAGIGTATAYLIIDAWNSYKTRVQACRFLLEHGITSTIANLAVDLWGSSAIDVVSADPYVLTALSDWGTVDAAAIRYFAVDLDCPRRIRGCCESICNMAVLRGKSALALHDFEQVFQAHMGMVTAPKDAIASSIGTGTVRLVRTGGSDFVQGAGMAEIESCVRYNLMSVLYRESEQRLQSNAVKHNAKLNEQELRFLAAFTRANVATVEASGAESIVAAQVLAKCFPKAIHIAPTGATFAKVGKVQLDWYLLREFIGNEDIACQDVAGATVVIHDSSSIDLLLVNKLLRNVRQAGRLIFIGSSESSRTSGLREIFTALLSEPNVVHENVNSFLGQYERASPLVRLPEILSGLSTLDDYCYALVQRVEASTHDELIDFTLQSYRAVFEDSPHDGIIVASKHSLVMEINHRIHGELLEYVRATATEPEPPIIKLRNKQEATVGDMVIYLGRDYSKGLFPGSRGIIAQISSDGRRRSSIISAAVARVLFDTAGYVDISLKECELMSLGHAVQVQHAALSRWNKVIVSMEPSKNLNHSWCWRALSRADGEIEVVAPKRAFEDALGRRESKSNYVPSLNLVKT
ncbi:helix-hairpin-helix domain-containing protein [Paraburkholderia sp. RL17-383-BIF-A]|uniref:helix-hairpin-helix domain-containing protein n=1 Tax=Paraburkholderia sp. RL17-383-BIF-A TaxID=3031631 RepID=UPI0038B7FF25